VEIIRLFLVIRKRNRFTQSLYVRNKKGRLCWPSFVIVSRGVQLTRFPSGFRSGFSRASRCAILQAVAPGHLHFRFMGQGALPHSVPAVPSSVFGDRVPGTLAAGFGKFMTLCFEYTIRIFINDTCWYIMSLQLLLCARFRKGTPGLERSQIVHCCVLCARLWQTPEYIVAGSG